MLKNVASSELQQAAAAAVAMIVITEFSKNVVICLSYVLLCWQSMDDCVLALMLTAESQLKVLSQK